GGITMVAGGTGTIAGSVTISSTGPVSLTIGTQTTFVANSGTSLQVTQGANAVATILNVASTSSLSITSGGSIKTDTAAALAVGPSLSLISTGGNIVLGNLINGAATITLGVEGNGTINGLAGAQLRGTVQRNINVFLGNDAVNFSENSANNITVTETSTSNLSGTPNASFVIATAPSITELSITAQGSITAPEPDGVATFPVTIGGASSTLSLTTTGRIAPITLGNPASAAAVIANGGMTLITTDHSNIGGTVSSA